MIGSGWRRSWLWLVVVLLAACGGGEERASAPADLLQAPLTDVRTGEVFSLSEYVGQTVLIEPMATW